MEARHRTLRGAIEWSLHLLSARLRRFFLRLSVFRGGWSLEAAEGVCEEELALDGLSELRECSLIVVEERGEGMRYAMLETLREYAIEQLSVEESSALRGRHLDYFLALAEEAAPKQEGSEQAEWFERLDEEHENLRAALDWSLTSDGREEIRSSSLVLQPGPIPSPVVAGLRLCRALVEFWFTRGFLSEGRKWCARALSASGAQERNVERATALNVAGILARSQGDYVSAVTYLEESLTIMREIGDRSGIAAALQNLGSVANSQGDYILARTYHEESLSIQREIGNWRGIAKSLQGLGLVVDSQGDYASARAYYEESLTITRETGNRKGTAQLLNSLGCVADNQGDDASGRAYFEESLTIMREIGDQSGTAAALNNLGGIAHSQGDYALARAYYEESLTISREIGYRQFLANSLENLGNMATEQGDYASARAYLEESLGIRKQIGDRSGITSSLEAFGRLAARVSRSEQAAALWGAAEALRTEIGWLLPPGERESYDRDLADAREALGAEAFATAWAKGRVMTLDQAIEIAQEIGRGIPSVDH